MSEVRTNSITDAAGTGAPNFPNGLESDGVAVATATEVAAAVPAGSVVQFARNTAPTGWLKANGAAVSRTDYAALFSAIGTTFGAGNGSTTFNLPDLRGEFMRGWDDGRGVDSSRVFGSAQADELKSHTHTTVEANQATSPAFSGVNYMMMTNGTANIRQVNATGGTETRPRNIALLVCIKF
jgi:microcystin-dependent protein